MNFFQMQYFVCMFVYVSVCVYVVTKKCAFLLREITDTLKEIPDLTAYNHSEVLCIVLLYVAYFRGVSVHNVNTFLEK